MLSFLRRLLGRKAPPLPAPAHVEARDSLDDLRNQIRRDVAGGFLSEDEILKNIIDIFEEEIDPVVVRREAPQLLRESLAAQAEAERNWAAITDCDRLDMAFAALEADGIISRQNFTCCGSCGAAEIWDEIEEVRNSALPARGYAFFHMQDTEAAAEGDGLYLNYGACEDDEAASLAVGQDIVATLAAHGLQADWNGSLATRIAVSLDWKKRRFKALP